ncbi:LOW QUALITY PROTEIN: putative endonuclease 4 [Aulostomus maculatus]
MIEENKGRKMEIITLELMFAFKWSWKRPALDQTAAAKFQEQCSTWFNSAHIMPHGSYLKNCGSHEDDALLMNELSHCSLLGFHLNFHPAPPGLITTEQCVDEIAGAINPQTPAVITDGGVTAMLDDDQFHFLKAMHGNDSKGKLGWKLDRHDDIGKGHIGIGFRDIVNEPRLILDTLGQ